MSSGRWGALLASVLSSVSVLSAVGALSAVCGCHAGAADSEKSEQQKSEADPKGEAPAENKPLVDPKIASAMAAARSNSDAREGAKGGQGAPPADGILGEEGAARELPAGSPAQLVLGADGAAPRVKLGAGPGAPAAPQGTLQLSYRSGGSVMPTVDLEFKAKVSGGTQPAGAAAGAASPGSDAVVTRFAFVNARPAADQPGRLPENARAEIAKLKGSWVDLVSDAHGAVQSQRFQVAGNNPVLQPLVQGSAVALASVALPYPEAPVGVGAYWMVKSRETAEGADVIAYRMVKLTELTPGAPAGGFARLTVNTRRYLITPRLALEGLPPHRVRQFQSEGSATLSLPIGAAYPTTAEIKDQFASLVSPDDRPQQPMPVQSEVSAKLTIGAAP